MKQILILLAFVALAGCEPTALEYRYTCGKLGIDRAPGATPSQEEPAVSTGVLQSEGKSDGVTRYLDTQLGVTCYVYSGTGKGGISCVTPTPMMGKR